MNLTQLLQFYSHLTMEIRAYDQSTNGHGNSTGYTSPLSATPFAFTEQTGPSADLQSTIQSMHPAPNSVLSSPKKYSLSVAQKAAWRVIELLRPHCVRLSVAGSIRREVAQVKDIEIVAIPMPYTTGLFEDGLAAVVNRWPKLKGELQYGKCRYTQRLLPNGMVLDLFFASAVNYGIILATRTGSAEYSHRVLATEWVRKGYKSIDGNLTKDGKIITVANEKDLFKRLNIPYLEPKLRNL